MAPRQFAAGCADLVEQVARLLERHGGRPRHIGHKPHGRDEQRAGDGVFLAVRTGVLVVKAVFAADKGRAIGHGRIVAPLGTAHQRPQTVGQGGVAPAKIVQDGQLVGVGPHSHGVAHRLVHGRPRHVVWVYKADFGANTVGQSNAFDCGMRNGECGMRLLCSSAPPLLCQFVDGHKNRPITRAVVGYADEGFDGRAALYLVVVEPNRLLFTANVGVAQEGEQGVGGGEGGRRGQPSGDRSGFPFGHQVALGDAIVQECFVELADEAVAVVHLETAVACEFAQHGCFHILTRAQLAQAGQMGGRHGQHHALLRLAEPNLPRP